MLKNKLKTFFIIGILVLFALSSFCFADNEEKNLLIKSNSGDNTESEYAKSSDEYLVGTDINIDYHIDGNLYVLADNVTISSRIVGNAFICANNINITNSGYISNELYALAHNINVDGYVYDIYTASENFTLTGSTYRDIHTIANNINLYGAVGRDAAVTFQNIDFSDKSVVFGNFDYTAENEINIPSGVVEGNTTFTKAENIKINLNITPNYLFLAISFVVLAVGLWLVFKWINPNFLDTASNLVAKNPFKSFGFGFLGFICMPIISVLLIIGMVSAVLGLLLLGLYLIFVCISISIFVIAINGLIAKKLNFDKSFKTFLLLIVTAIIAWALTIIPFAGGIFVILYSIIGFGIILRSLISKKDKIAIEE